MAVRDVDSEEAPLVLMPVHNDWDAAAAVLRLLDAELARHSLSARVLIVDDGSTSPAPAGWCQEPFQAVRPVEILELRCNLGHQRALAVGLAFVEANRSCPAIVIMDGDGEDAPQDVPRLLERFAAEGGRAIVFAERTRRTEGLLFRWFYQAYRWLHWLLTGHRVRVGNFSVAPRALVSRLVASSDLWNHYAASVFKARLPYVTLPTPRAKRLAGQSRMNFVALVIHGLSAMSVFSDRIGVRLLMLSALVLALATAGLGAVLAIRFTTDWAIAGWATTAAGILAIVALQGLMMMIVFIMVVLGGRGTAGFLPIRDHVYYVGRVRKVGADESL